MLYLEDFEVGKWRESKESYIVTEDEIIEVARRWDPQPFHIDREVASGSLFGGLVACSSHLFAIVCWLAHHMEDSTAAVAGLGWDKIRMHAPVMAGDEISCKVQCLESRPSNSQPGCGVITVYNELYNQRGELVYTAQCSFLVQCRPQS
jgi:acyl dehydratase